ncbi:MAG TPA: LacI family DNA-binding transcriptional regulator [Flavisolibacter sp.]|nr:LacI family DNA-binding transcriptional regulator [Flavisolibacter sp.]
MRNVSLKDIAQRVGTSISTVSFVLNGKEKQVRISETLAQKIKEVANKEGYRPNRMAVGLKTGKSNIIGLVVDTISGHLFAALAEVIEKELDQHGYKVIYCSTRNDAQKGKELVQLLYQHQVDGYMIIPTPGMENEIRALEEQGKPLVLIDSYFPKLKAAHVLVDNYDGINKAVEFLLEKGYEKIAFVYNDVSMIQMKERQRAYRERMKQAGIRVSSQWLLEVPIADDRREQTLKIQTFLEKVKPDAVLFAANYLGIHGIQAIHNLNLRFPADIGVVCFDDHELFSLHQPAVTVVQQPVTKLAKTAVRILVAKLKNKPLSIPDEMEVKATLIKRHSTR